MSTFIKIYNSRSGLHWCGAFDVGHYTQNVLINGDRKLSYKPCVYKRGSSKPPEHSVYNVEDCVYKIGNTYYFPGRTHRFIHTGHGCSGLRLCRRRAVWLQFMQPLRYRNIPGTSNANILPHVSHQHDHSHPRGCYLHRLRVSSGAIQGFIWVL
jgi:hypothetical protein